MFNLSDVVFQHLTAATTPFITNDDNDCAKLFKMTETALSQIPMSIKMPGMDYPDLRVFASWPGDAKLCRTLRWREAMPKGSKQMKTQMFQESDSEDSDATGAVDPDGHPLATLHLENFAKDLSGT